MASPAETRAPPADEHGWVSSRVRVWIGLAGLLAVLSWSAACDSPAPPEPASDETAERSMPPAKVPPVNQVDGGDLREIERIEGLVERGELEAARDASRQLITTRRSALADALDLRVEVLWLSGQAEGESILEFAREAVRIRRDVFDREKHDGSLVNLATLLLVRGRYEEAKPLLAEAQEFYVLSAQAEAPNATLRRREANCLNTLGGVYHHLGDHERSRECFERALEYRRELPDPAKAALTSTTINLALLLTDMEEWSQARKRFEEAQRLWSRPEYRNDIDRASGMNNFAWLLFQLGEHESAAELFAQALELRRRVLPDDHPHIAWTLHNLGALHLSRGRLDEAEPLLQRAFEIRKGAFQGHPVLVHSLRELALLRLAQSKYQSAMELCTGAEDIAVEHLRLQISALNEQTALRFAASRYSALDVMLSALLDLPDGSPETRARQFKTVWATVARSRALVLDEIGFRRRAARLGSASDPVLKSLWKDFEAATAKLARLSLPGAGGPAKEELAKARAARDGTEEELARRSREFARRSSPPSLDATLNAVPPKAALVAYTRYQRFTTAEGSGPEARPAYLAFVKPAGQSETVAVALGDAVRIDRLVKSWREKLLEILALKPDDTAAQDRQEGELARIGNELRERVWDPIVPSIRNAELVLVVPDGSIHRLAFSALPRSGSSDGKPSYLVEGERQIHLLSAERDVAAFESESLRPSSRTGLLALGDVDFGEGKWPGEGADAGADAAAPRLFGPLPATRDELASIESLWRSHRPGSRVQLLTSLDASETRFRELAPQFRFLHLATHGFFLDGRPLVAGPSTRAIGVAPAREDSSGAVRIENPLLRSGLALAGANEARWAADGSEDGILSAEEVGVLDLSGTEWVVLSACDTGVGEIQNGEGILGLSRAFRAAGARSLILSLWPVDDRSSRDWMRSLYEARWKDGLSTAESVRRASLQVLESRRSKGLSTHPFFWSAFVATGDWR